MWTEQVDDPLTEDGLCSIEAEFYTEQFVVRGDLISPEARLSDHLNSSTTMLEVRPTHVHRSLSGLPINVAGNYAYIAKGHLLFVLPIDEPEVPSSVENGYWTRTITTTCWAGLGRFSLVGRVHMEAGRNPRLFLRSLEQRQFVPFTNVRLTFPDGTVREYPSVFVNRFHLELLAVEGEPG